MSRPRLLDLFCGAGGAAMGAHRAGFDVVGVDNVDQPHYPFPMVRADALEALTAFGTLFDAVWASPPCKAHTKTGWAYHFGYHANHTDLLTPTRALLEQTQRPWVIENVPGAPMRVDMVLCGSQFGLGVRRHRWFEFSEPPFQLMAPCVHDSHVVTPLGNPNKARGSRREWAEAMEIDWTATARELSQAVPPAYGEYVGRLLLAQVHASTHG